MSASRKLVNTENVVGLRLRQLRSMKKLSLRALASRSGLSVNTLSLIENGKTSPSVGTLQQLAVVLEVPITAFFESESIKKPVVFTPARKAFRSLLNKMWMDNLGKDLNRNDIQPFKVTLLSGSGSGKRLVAHMGYEFVYCLGGSLHYEIEQNSYQLNMGDSLVFDASLPHCWENNGNENTEFLLIFFPGDQQEEVGSYHFSQ